jgi:low affinity Fe/Cu permease
MDEWMRRFAIRTSTILGSSWSILVGFAMALTMVVFIGRGGFSQERLWDCAAWLTIVTFLLVIILQNAQNRHDRALHLKLDELLRAVEGARTHMVHLQGMSEEEIEKLETEFEDLRAAERLRSGAPGIASSKV